MRNDQNRGCNSFHPIWDTQPPRQSQLRRSFLCMTLLDLNRILYSCWQWFNSPLNESVVSPSPSSFQASSSMHLWRAVHRERKNQFAFSQKVAAKQCMWWLLHYFLKFSLNVNQIKISCWQDTDWPAPLWAGHLKLPEVLQTAPRRFVLEVCWTFREKYIDFSRFHNFMLFE